MDTQIELSLVDLADRSQKARLRTLLGSKRGRKKFLNSLYHDAPFDARYVTVLWHGIYEALVKCGAPDECYVMSPTSRLDGTHVRLEDALAEFNEATILICIPGRLIYYASEDELEQWIVQRAR